MPFCRLVEPRPENAWIKPSGTHSIDFRNQCQKMRKSDLLTNFVEFWSQCQKILKSGTLGPILSTSEAKARKSSNRTSWTSFYPLLETQPENAENGPSGTHFVDFWNQGQKILESDLLEPILSTSGAKASKCLNLTSWTPFCRLLEPMPANA